MASGVRLFVHLGTGAGCVHTAVPLDAKLLVSGQAAFLVLQGRRCWFNAMPGAGCLQLHRELQQRAQPFSMAKMEWLGERRRRSVLQKPAGPQAACISCSWSLPSIYSSALSCGGVLKAYVGKTAEPVRNSRHYHVASKLHIFPYGWACFVPLEPQ